MFNALPPPLNFAVPFVIVLGVLVFIHELGHYLAARWRGVHVEAFSIGYGRALLSWADRRGTVWKIAWLPLGGYVKLHGQEQPADVSDEVRASWIPGRTFHEKSVGSRAIVVAAGPVANFLLAAVLFAFLFAAAGRPVMLPDVAKVAEGSAAERGGLMAGDEITAIDAQPIAQFEDIQRIIAANPGRALPVAVQRNGAALTLTVTPDRREIGEGRAVGVLGIAGGAVSYIKLPVTEAIPAGIEQTWSVTVQTLDGVWQMITGKRGAEDLGGPLRIAQLSGQVAELGVANLVNFVAVLSINLGLLNLFPIPVLDGGHLLFFLAEAVRGRPLPLRTLEYGYRAGFALIAGLFVFATLNDLTHLGLFRWVAALIG